MTNENNYKLLSVPAHSLLALPQKEREEYYAKIFSLPDKTRKILLAPQTGAFIRGLIRSYQVPPEKGWSLSLGVLNVAVNKMPLAKLPGFISAKAGISNDKANKIAREIEEDLFGQEIKQELTAHREQQKNQPPQPDENQTTQPEADNNVLNLKQQPKPPQPPWRQNQQNTANKSQTKHNIQTDQKRKYGQQ